MAIDIHCHLWVRDFIPEVYWNAQADFLAQWTSGRGNPATAEEIAEAVFPSYWDPHGRATIQRMDEAGIERAVILPIDFGWEMGQTNISIEEQNRHAAGVVQLYRHRLQFFCGVDPRRPDAAELFERCLTQWGATGLKFHTIAGFYPDDRQAYPLLERAASEKLPLLVHTGLLFPPLESQYAHPTHLQRILDDFPQLKVIAAHLSFTWWRELMEVGRERENLMADVSGLQLAAEENYGRFCHILRRFLDSWGSHRIMFGTDSPTFDPFVSRKRWVEYVRRLPTDSPQGINFTEEEVWAIIHQNAQNLLAGNNPKMT